MAFALRSQRRDWQPPEPPPNVSVVIGGVRVTRCLRRDGSETDKQARARLGDILAETLARLNKEVRR